MQCQCCDSICVYTGDSNAIEHEEKNDGNSGHGISTERNDGSEMCEDEGKATVLQVQVSSPEASEKEMYPEHGRWFAIDTGASVTLSGMKSDFISEIEVGTERVNGMQIEGICGTVNVNGYGTIATVVQAFNQSGKASMPVSIYDQNGIYLEGSCERIFNADKLASMGCVLKTNYWSEGSIPKWIPEYENSEKTRHVLISEQDATVVPLYKYKDVLSARSRKLDVRKLPFSDYSLAILNGMLQHKGFVEDKCLSESPRPLGSIAMTKNGCNGETEVNVSQDPNIRKDPNFEKDTIFEKDPDGKNGKETDANGKEGIVSKIDGPSNVKRAKVMMIRCTKVEKVDSEEGQNMAKIGAKNRFETVGGNDNADVRTEIRQNEGARACTNSTGPKNGQKHEHNESSDAKVSPNLGSEKSDKGNIQNDRKMTSGTEICNVKSEKARNGYESQCAFLPNGANPPEAPDNSFSESEVEQKKCQNTQFLGSFQKNGQMTSGAEICNVKTEKARDGHEKQCAITSIGQSTQEQSDNSFSESEVKQEKWPKSVFLEPNSKILVSTVYDGEYPGRSWAITGRLKKVNKDDLTLSNEWLLSLQSSDTDRSHFEPSTKMYPTEVKWGYGTKGNKKTKFQDEIWKEVNDSVKLARMQYAFNCKRADSKFLKIQLANLHKGIVNNEGQIADLNPETGELIGVEMKDENASDISSDAYSDMSEGESDVESYYELEPESSDHPDGPQIHRKSWRSKSKLNGVINSDPTDSTEKASDVGSETPKITLQIGMIHVAEHGQDPSPDEKVPTLAHEAGTRNSSGISSGSQKASSSKATKEGTKKLQEQKNEQGWSDKKGEAYMQDQQPNLLNKLKSDANLNDPEIQKEIGEMILMGQDTERCYSPMELNEDKKEMKYRHLPEGENATPVPIGCTMIEMNQHLASANGRKAMELLREKGATEKSIRYAMERVAVTGDTWPERHDAAILTPIKNDKGETVGNIFMNSTGVSWSVRNDDTENIEILRWKLRVEMETQAKITRTDQDLEWFCIPKKPMFVSIQGDQHRKWQICACRKLNGEIRLVLQDCTRERNGTDRNDEPKKKILRQANHINWTSFDDRKDFFQSENWWHLVYAELLVKHGINCRNPDRDPSGLSLGNPYKEDGSTLAELKGKVKSDWDQHMTPIKVQMYVRSQCWPSQSQKEHEVHTGPEMQMTMRIHALEDQKKYEKEAGSPTENECDGYPCIIEPARYVKETMWYPGNTRGGVPVLPIIPSNTRRCVPVLTMESRNETASGSSKKRSRSQNEVDSDRQGQRRMRVFPDNFQSTESQTGVCRIQLSENELRMQGEILIEVEEEIVNDCATVEVNPEWRIYTTRNNGEFLLSIAAKFGLTTKEILSDNDQLYYQNGSGEKARWTPPSQMVFRQGTQIWLHCDKSEFVSGAEQRYGMLRDTIKHFSHLRKSELHLLPIWSIKEKFPFLPDDPKHILFVLVSDDWWTMIERLRNEMNQWTRKGVLNEIRYEDRQIGKQIFTICDSSDKIEKCDLGEVGAESPRAAAARTTTMFMELTAHCTSEPWHADCSTATAAEGLETYYAYRPIAMDILYKSDKDLFELRVQLLKMNRDQIQALYKHMCESKERKLWVITDSIHRSPAPGLQWSKKIITWLKLGLGFSSHRGSNVYFGHSAHSGGQVYVAVYYDHIAWNGTNVSKRWFEQKYFEVCTGTTSYEWNSYTSVEIDFTTGNCCIEFDQPKKFYCGKHGCYVDYW